MERLLVLKLDVTKQQDIIDAFQKAKEVFGRVDVVFNNAAYGVLAEVEGTPDDAARAVFDVDFWGAANVSREAVRFFREVLSVLLNSSQDAWGWEAGTSGAYRMIEPLLAGSGRAVSWVNGV